MTVSRREALKALATGIGSVGVWPYLSETAAHAFAEIQATNAAPKPVVLTPNQFATVDALSETIIPADDHSPGAHAARVADYIDLLLSESEERTRKAWIDGLDALDNLTRRRFKTTYVQASPEQRVAVLTEIARREANPRSVLERFFKSAKDATIRGYYTSEIGIHQELQYKGNQFLKEFVGCTHPEHGYTP